MAKWSIPVPQFIGHIETYLEQVVEAITLELFTRLVPRSPVDQGRFMASWLVAFDDWPGGVSVDFGLSVTEGGDRDINMGAAYHEAMKQVPNISNYRLGQTIFIANNIPYGPDLELGSSKQAPHGMVRITAEEFPEICQVAVRKINSGNRR